MNSPVQPQTAALLSPSCVSGLSAYINVVQLAERERENTAVEKDEVDLFQPEGPGGAGPADPGPG